MRLATFNIGMAGLRVMGKMLREGVPHTRERWPAILHHLQQNPHDIDIWLLQEAYGSRVTRALKSLPDFGVVTSRELGRDRGLAVLARRSLVLDGVGSLDYKPYDIVERFIAPKGLIVTKIDGPFGSLYVANLHTSYDGFRASGLSRSAAAHRRLQMLRTKDLLNAVAPNSVCIIGGDFNFSPLYEPSSFAPLKEADWHVVPSRASDDACRDRFTWSSDNPLIPASHGYPDQNIDMLLTRGLQGTPHSCQVFMTEWSVPVGKGIYVPHSDHYGLVLSFDFD